MILLAATTACGGAPPANPPTSNPTASSPAGPAEAAAGRSAATATVGPALTPLAHAAAAGFTESTSPQRVEVGRGEEPQRGEAGAGSESATLALTTSNGATATPRPPTSTATAILPTATRPLATATPTPTATPTVEPTATVEPTTTPTATPAQHGQAEPRGRDCPPEYPIKGNINSQGEHIYHPPSGSFYTRTIPEACFATEADAREAGFRASLR